MRKFAARFMAAMLILSLCLEVWLPIPAAAAAKPKKVTIQSVQDAGSGTLKVTWKKVSAASKYQIQTAANKKFTKEKLGKTVSAKKSAAVIKGLKPGKKYFVRVRAFRTAGGKKICGKWSAVKSIRLKSGTGSGTGESGKPGNGSGNSGNEGGDGKEDDADAKEISESDFTISIKSSYPYTGKEIKPAVASATLTKGKDYTVTYANNVNAGKATITITGTGKYRGTVTKQFTISKAKQTIKATLSDMMETGKSQKISVSGAYGDVKYEASPDGIVSVAADGTVKALKKGTASIYISASGDENHLACSKVSVGKVTVADKKLETQKISVKLGGSEIMIGSVRQLEVKGAYGELTWQFSTDGIVSIDKDCKMTALKLGTTSIYLSAGGDATHKPCERYYVGKIEVTKKVKRGQKVTAELQSETMYVGETQKIDVSGAYGKVTFKSDAKEEIVSISPDGTVTALKAGRTWVLISVDETEEYFGNSDQLVGTLTVAQREATASGFDGGLVGPYKKESYYNEGRNADGSTTFSINYYTNADEAWMDKHVTFEVQDVTAKAYAKMYRDMGVPAGAQLTVQSVTDRIGSNNSKKVFLPFNEKGPVSCDELAISGKRITVQVSAGTRVVKVIAKQDGEMVDYIYLGSSNTAVKGDGVAFDLDLYRRVRARVESKLWTDDMTNAEKLGKLMGYINATTHYPDTATTNPYYNPTFWEEWSVDGRILEYWMYEDVLLSRTMALQGGITDCYGAEILNKAAQEDLGLPYLYDGKNFAEGEGVWIGKGSQSSNTFNPSHVSLCYQYADGTRVYFDAQGMNGGSSGETAACEVHGCKSKIIPLN